MDLEINTLSIKPAKHVKIRIKKNKECKKYKKEKSKIKPPIEYIEPLTDGMSPGMLNELLDNFIRTREIQESINDKLSRKKIRYDNFPSHISENLVKFAIAKTYGSIPNWDTKKGELEMDGKKLEVKAFSSIGPSSFGPTEDWDILYFVNAIDFKDKRFIVYECKLSSNDSIWRNIKVNNNDTFDDHCNQRRRPRINFNKLYEQLENHINVIWSGHITDFDKFNIYQ